MSHTTSPAHLPQISVTNYSMELEPTLGSFLEPYLPKKHNGVKENKPQTPSTYLRAVSPAAETSQLGEQPTSEKLQDAQDKTTSSRSKRPFITLTWAQSIDGRIAGAVGTRTRISGPETKVMTHYQRSRHDAILVGARTALTDDPKLNCRFPETGAHMIRPVVVDPSARWCYSTSTARQVFLQKAGIAPFIVVKKDAPVKEEEESLLEKDGGRYVRLDLGLDLEANWNLIFDGLGDLGIKSVMVEGGSFVIESLITLGLPDSVIITIGSVFLGRHGVSVSPQIALKLEEVTWWRGHEDAVVAGRPAKTD